MENKMSQAVKQMDRPMGGESRKDPMYYWDY